MKYICIVLACSISVLFTGCSIHQSMDSYINQLEDNTQKETTSDLSGKVYTYPYGDVAIASDSNIVTLGEQAVVTTGDNNISITVFKFKIAHSLYDLEEFSGYYQGDFIKNVKEMSFNNNLSDDGTFICGFDDKSNTVILYLKALITNNSDYETTCDLNQLKIVDMNETRTAYREIFSCSDFIFDKMQSFGRESAYYSFRPGESIETVMIYVIPEKKINSYRCENGKNIIVSSSEYDYANLYLRCNASGERNSCSGEYYIHLDLGGID